MIFIFIICLLCKPIIDLSKLKEKIEDAYCLQKNTKLLNAKVEYDHILLIYFLDFLITIRSKNPDTFDLKLSKLQKINTFEDKKIVVPLKDEKRILGTVIFYDKNSYEFANMIVNKNEEISFKECDYIFKSLECDFILAFFMNVYFVLRLPEKINSIARKYFFEYLKKELSL